jgi:hypothetical protein
MAKTRAHRVAGMPSAVIPGRASFLARARNPYSRMVVMDSGPAPSGASRNDEGETDCFAEPVIGRAFARPFGSTADGAGCRTAHRACMTRRPNHLTSPVQPDCWHTHVVSACQTYQK